MKTIIILPPVWSSPELESRNGKRTDSQEQESFNKHGSDLPMPQWRDLSGPSQLMPGGGSCPLLLSDQANTIDQTIDPCVAKIC